LLLAAPRCSRGLPARYSSTPGLSFAPSRCPAAAVGMGAAGLRERRAGPSFFFFFFFARPSPCRWRMGAAALVALLCGCRIGVGPCRRGDCRTSWAASRTRVHRFVRAPRGAPRYGTRADQQVLLAASHLGAVRPSPDSPPFRAEAAPPGPRCRASAARWPPRSVVKISFPHRREIQQTLLAAGR